MTGFRCTKRMSFCKGFSVACSQARQSPQPHGRVPLETRCPNSTVRFLRFPPGNRKPEPPPTLVLRPKSELKRGRGEGRVRARQKKHSWAGESRGAPPVSSPGPAGPDTALLRKRGNSSPSPAQPSPAPASP